MLHTAKALAALSLTLMLTLLCSCSQKQAQEGGGAGEGGGGEISPRYAQQSQMMETALKDDPKNAGILIQLGNMYYDWGESEAQSKGGTAQPGEKWAKAVDCYKRALELQPSNVNVRVDMANLLGFLNRTDEAIAEYNLSIKTDPAHPQARINLILALGQGKHDYKGAIREYDALLAAIPAQKDNTDLKQAVDGFKEAMKEAKK